jgi:hypothetical protein
MTQTFSLKWKPFGNEAEQLISMALEHLDLRKKHLKDSDKNTRIVASILAQRLGEFVVRMTSIDKGDREALREVLECLTGPVLTRGAGKGTYALRGAYIDPQAVFITGEPEVVLGRAVPPIKTGHGTIYRDGTQGEVPFSEIKLFGFSKPSLVRVVAPHEHWHVFLGDKPALSANWKELIESDTPHDQHDEFMDFVVAQGNMRGVAITRYGDDAFLAVNPDVVLFTLDNALVRFTGKAMQRPLVHVIDQWGRTHVRWGSTAQ